MRSFKKSKMFRRETRNFFLLKNYLRDLSTFIYTIIAKKRALTCPSFRFFNRANV